MAQWVDMYSLENKNHTSLMLFWTLWVQSNKSIFSNQPQVGWPRTDIRSVRDFYSFHVYPLSHMEGYCEFSNLLAKNAQKFCDEQL